MQKIIVVLGPTATGKSDMSVLLAKEFNGEVISADSRQVYKGMNIGTGKITKKEMCGVKHYMLDVVSPKTKYSVAKWKKETEKSIDKIYSKNKIPIICGGTGFYIQSIVDGIIFPEVIPNEKLRKKLKNKSVSELLYILKKLDPKIIRAIDQKNPVRLMRAIEIATKIGKVPPIKTHKKFDVLIIGLTLPDNELKERIKNRLLKRIKMGMIKEAEKLHKEGLTWKRMFDFGLEYRYESLLLQKKISKEEFIEKLNTEIWKYAKRQKTWFKKDKRIKWFSPAEFNKIKMETVDFLNKK